MSTLADQINKQVEARRHNIERSLGNMRKLDVRRVPPAGFVAAGLLVTAVAIGAAWMVYRSRRRRTLVQRLRDALPDNVRDLPGEVRSQVRRVGAM